MLVDNIDLILDALNIDYNQTRGRFFFPCPIHGSDNYSSCSIYQNSGVWRCFTRGCHKENQSIIGFISAYLKCSTDEGYQFCKNVLSGATHARITKPVKPSIDYRFKSIPRQTILPFINDRIEFYLRRGYSQEILKKYDVFIGKKRTNNLYGRVIFPIYDELRENIIGFTGRTLNPQCKLCKKYHSTSKPCPTNPYDKIRAEKWLNSRGFNRNSTLFNYWFAKQELLTKKEGILVEGQGDVLKLEMANIHNSLGIFGTELTQSQISMLDKLGLNKLYIATDSDAAGTEAAEKIKEQLKNVTETYRLILKEKDFGEMDVNEIVEYFSSL